MAKYPHLQRSLSRLFYFLQLSAIATTLSFQSGADSVAVEKPVSAALSPSYPVPSGNTSFRIPFQVTDGIFVTNKPYFYFVKYESNSVARMNITNGLIDREWRLPSRPNILNATSSGKRIFIGSGNDPSNENNNGDGWIHEIDEESGFIVREFPIGISPFQLVALNNGQIIVAGGISPSRNDLQEVNSYNVAEGAKIENVFVGGAVHRIVATDTETELYGALQGGGGMWRTSIDPLTGRFSEHRNVSGEGYTDLWVINNSTNLLVGDGRILALTSKSASDLRVYKRLNETFISAAVEIPERGLIAIITPGQNSFKLVYYPPDWSTPFLVQDCPQKILRAQKFEGKLYLAAFEGKETIVAGRPLAATNATNNQPPVLNLSRNFTDVLLLGSPGTSTVVAEDADGKVVSLAFYTNGVLAAQSTNTSGEFVWKPPTGGIFTLGFEATDNLGGTSITNITVFANVPPKVVFKSPPTNVLASPAILDVEVLADDEDGSVEEVSFYYKSAHYPRNPLLKTITAPPYRLVITNFVSIGGNLTAIAKDNHGATTVLSATIPISGLPGDDEFIPYLLEGLTATSVANNLSATFQSSELKQVTYSNTLWWEWTAPTNGSVYVSTEGSTFDTALEIYTPPLYYLYPTFNDDGPKPPFSLAKFYSAAGDVVRIKVVGTHYSETGDINLKVTQMPLMTDTNPSPANDLIINAIVLSGSSATVAANNLGATKEPGEAGIIDKKPSKSIWWQWTSPTDAFIRVYTSNSDFDPALAVYDRSAPTLTKLRLIAANDDSSGSEASVRFLARANTNYVIGIDGVAGQYGSTVLNLVTEPADAPPPPENDNFADRIHAEGDSVRLEAVMTSATPEPGEPIVGDALESWPSAWWSWKAQKSGLVYVVGTRVSDVGRPAWLNFLVCEGDTLETIKVLATPIPRLSSGSLGEKSVVVFNAEAGKEYSIIAKHLRTTEATIFIQTLSKTEFGFRSLGIGSSGISAELLSMHRGVALEKSTDLLHWTPYTNIVSVGTNGLVFPRESAGRSFFRANSFE